MENTKLIRKLVLNWNSIFAALFIMGILAYSLQIPWLGFYWDDWPWVWFSHVMGPEGMLQIDIEHRPLSGVVLWIGSQLFGENPRGWQIYSLTLRMIGAGAFGWFLQKLWPHHKEKIVWTTLLFLIYPGFGQQHVAVNNSRHLFPLITFFVSMGYMVKANRSQRYYWQFTVVALSLSFVTMFTTEYYYGLTLIRPLVLWLLISKRKKPIFKTIIDTFISWLPYLISMIGIFGWRYSISQRVNYQITLFNELTSSPNQTLAQLIWSGLQDIFSSGIGVWFSVFTPLDPILFGPRTSLFYWGIVLIGTVITLLYLIIIHKKDNKDLLAVEMLILGGVGLLLGPIPFWVTGLDLKMIFPADRLTLPMIFGSSLMLAGIIDILLKKEAIKVLLLSLIIGFSCGVHNLNAMQYRKDWNYQISFFHQLTTRIPNFKADTAIFINELSNNRSTDNSLTAPVNWIYNPEYASGNMPIQMYYIDLRFGRDEVMVDENTTLAGIYRFFPYQSSLQEILIIYHNPPACLRVMEDQRHLYYPMLPSYMKAVLPYSNIDQIVTNTLSPINFPSYLNSRAQPNNWCYYFEQADLARQREDWAQIAELGDIAFTLTDSPNHASECTLFIEGYAHAEQWSRAEDLTYEVIEINKFMRHMLCDTWERIETETLPSTKRDGILYKIN